MLKTPNVGRPVLFYSDTVANKNPQEPGRGHNGVGAGPYAAVITQVFRDGAGNVTYCNLKVFPPFAPPFDEGSVSYWNAAYEADVPPPGRFWCWEDDVAGGTPHSESPKVA